MKEDARRRFAFSVALIAALLAWIAVLVHYIKHGDLNIGLIAASLVMIAFAFAARKAPPQ